MYSNKTLFNNIKPNKNRWQIRFGQRSNSLLTHVKDGFFRHELARATPSHKSTAAPRDVVHSLALLEAGPQGMFQSTLLGNTKLLPEWTHTFAFHEQCGSVPITKILTST